MKKNVLEAIFFDENNNWDKFLKKHGRRVRPVVKNEVKKFRYCGDIRMGYRLFVCEGCHKIKHIPLKCKGKFCPSCDAGESQKWAAATANDLFSVIHRHVIFTIDEGLRDIFLMEKYRSELLKGLMDEAAKIMLDFFQKKSIRYKRVLWQQFIRLDQNWNSIHMSIWWLPCEESHQKGNGKIMIICHIKC